jgi:parvulin-like peptidyl-prolyl isomerase
MQKLSLYAAIAVFASHLLGCSDASDSTRNETPESSGRVAEGADASRVSPTASQTDEAKVPSEVSAAHILVMYAGSARAPESVTRSKEEALELAESITKMAKAPDADFAALAKQYSDGPSGPRGGSLGNFAPNGMVKPFADALLKLEIGDVSGVVETQFGYHIIQRQEVKEIPKASAKHILVMYQGSMRAPPSITRSKEEAYARIEECLERARAGEKFEDLALEYSDGPTGRTGGDLGEFQQGQMAPAFEEATFSCEVGGITEIVETPFGYHIIYRYK